MLGFLDTPRNSLVLTPRFLPSKVGGQPAWISKEGIPQSKCDICGYHLSFLMQLYANIASQELADFERMIYVFACLSEKCIGEQRAIKVYRAIIHKKNPQIQFADDKEFDQVLSMTDEELTKLGKLDLTQEQEEESKQEELNQKDIEIQFEEFIIDTDFEASEVIDFYMEESQRIKNKVKNNQEQVEEEDESKLEQVYLAKVLNTKQDEKHIQKLLQKYNENETQQQTMENNEDFGGKNEDLEDIEQQTLEKFIETNHGNYAKITDQFKLFEYVCQSNPDQVLRYCRSGLIEPLWVSDKKILKSNQDIPKCEKCGSKRIYEFQIMPQLFNYLGELRLVDWETIVIYTCSNTKCLPDFSKGNYIQEFAYIQFSDDFANVQLGDEAQIKKQHQLKQQQEQQPQTIEQQTEKSKSKDKVKKKKNKKKKQEVKEENTRENVNAQVQSQLQDLMNNFNLNGQQ